MSRDLRVAGYAATFDQPNERREVLRRGAFATQEWPLFLLADHVVGRPSYASSRRGTLETQEDGYGLWFQATLDDDAEGFEMWCLIRFAGVTGISVGGSGWQHRQEGRLKAFVCMPIYELSVLTSGGPRFPGTWVAPLDDARRRRLEMRS